MVQVLTSNVEMLLVINNTNNSYDILDLLILSLE